MTTIDLKQEVPYVECRFGDKTFRVYANDENIKSLSQLVTVYQDFQKKADAIDKKGKDGKIDSSNYESTIDDLLAGIKNDFASVMDRVLGSNGIGEKIWEFKHGSTEYLIFTLAEIQAALKKEQKKYAYNRDQKIEQIYPAKKPKKITHLKTTRR